MAAGRQGFLRRAAYPLAALGFLLGAALLLREPAAPRVRRAPPAFPRHPSAEELQRASERASWVPPPRRVPEPDAPLEPPQPERADPLHLALADQDSALVVEIGVLEDAPLGRMLIACLSPEQRSRLEDFEQTTGLQLFEQLDRIAVAGSADEGEPMLLLSGNFSDLDPSALHPGGKPTPYGARAQWAERGGTATALWGGELLLLGSTGAVRETLARLEGERPWSTPSAAGEAYGEIYGSMSGRAASRLVPGELRKRIAQAAERITVHVDATEDVLLVAQVFGSHQEPLRDLATAIGGALALGRLHAVQENQPLLSDLLDESRVIPDTGSFQLEMALPLASLREHLGACAQAAENTTP